MKGIFLGPVGTSFETWATNALQNIERWVNTLTEFRGATAARDGADGLVPQPKLGQQDYVLHGDGKFRPGGGGGGSSTFLGLSDTPDAYTASAGMVVSVKPDLTGLEFTTAAGGGNVSAVPTPSNGHVAVWTDPTHIKGFGTFRYETNTMFLTRTVSGDCIALEGLDMGTFGPGLSFFHNSLSPAAGDTIGNMGFYANDAFLNPRQIYASLQAKIIDPTSGARSGSFSFSTLKNNVAIVSLTITNDGVTVGTDDPYGPSWDGSLALPTKNAIYDKIQAITVGGGGNVVGPASATDNAVVRFDATTGKLIQNSLTTISDTGTLATPIVTVTDEAYGATWDGSTAVPTKNAVYDKIQTLGAGGGGNVSNVGTPVDNQIAIWSDATHIDGSANFTFNSATGGFVMTGQMIFFVLPTTTLAQSLRSTDAGAVGPGQEFFHNSPSPAVDDTVGYIDFWGRNAAAALANYGKLTVTIADVAAGTEDGAINSYVLKAGTLTNISVLNANGLTVFGNVFVTDEAYGPTWDGSTAVPTKNAVYDKIQSMAAGGGGNVSNAGAPLDNQVAVWTGPNNIEGSANFTYDGSSLVITRPLTGDCIQVVNSEPGVFGPGISFYQNSPSPAANDTVGNFGFYGNDSAAAKQIYASFQTKITDPTAGARSGSFSLSTLKNNVAIISMTITNDGITVGTDDPYGAGWDGSLMLPTKNAIYDKIQSMSAGSGLLAASQAEQEAASSVTVGVTPGRQQFHPSSCKAWVTFATVTTTANNASFNVGSLTDNGVGDTTITFTVNFSSANYAIVCGPGNDSTASIGRTLQVRTNTPPTSSTVRVFSVRGDTNAGQDQTVNSVACFGDQP